MTLGKLTDSVREFMVETAQCSIDLREIIVRAGGELVDERGEDVIDLSPEALSKDTLISLFIN